MTALNRCLAPALSLFVATALCQMPGHTNLPYTATKKETFVQKLADGTTISRVNTTTEARDSQGRTMQTNSPCFTRRNERALNRGLFPRSVSRPIAAASKTWNI